MDREIKFRAWDGDNFRMYYSDKNNEDIIWTIFENNIYIQELTQFDTNPGGFGHEQTYDYVRIENQVLMQYTGLKDKNGVEIYEGDIVKYGTWALESADYYRDSKRRIINIVFNPKKAAYMASDNDVWNFAIYSDVEVIGNIYENPELIKPQNG